MSSLAIDFGMIRIGRLLELRSMNVIFTKKVLYKDKSSGDLEGAVQENFEFVSLDIPKITPQEKILCYGNSCCYIR